MPHFKEHEKFIKSKPYRYWYLIYKKDPIGTFYIQEDNSIGMNFSTFNQHYVFQTLDFIMKEFSPKNGLPSKVPPYFYVNVAADDVKTKIL